MPVEANTIVRKYFELLKTEGVHVCKVNACGDGIADKKEFWRNSRIKVQLFEFLIIITDLDP